MFQSKNIRRFPNVLMKMELDRAKNLKQDLINISQKIDKYLTYLSCKSTQYVAIKFY